jgi:sulfur relay (sulfurtransferase) DsrF/TusC family protein
MIFVKNKSQFCKHNTIFTLCSGRKNTTILYTTQQHITKQTTIYTTIQHFVVRQSLQHICKKKEHTNLYTTFFFTKLHKHLTKLYRILQKLYKPIHTNTKAIQNYRQLYTTTPQLFKTKIIYTNTTNIHKATTTQNNTKLHKTIHNYTQLY